MVMKLTPTTREQKQELFKLREQNYSVGERARMVGTPTDGARKRTQSGNANGKALAPGTTQFNSKKGVVARGNAPTTAGSGLGPNDRIDLTGGTSINKGRLGG